MKITEYQLYQKPHIRRFLQDFGGRTGSRPQQCPWEGLEVESWDREGHRCPNPCLHAPSPALPLQGWGRGASGRGLRGGRSWGSTQSRSSLLLPSRSPVTGEVAVTLSSARPYLSPAATQPAVAHCSLASPRREGCRQAAARVV